MGKVVLYDGFSNKMRTVQAEGTVAEAIHKIDSKIDVKKCVCLVQGEDVRADYIVKDSDIVFVREAAEGATCMIIMGVIGVVSAVAALGMGVYSFIKMRQAQDEADKAMRASKAMSEQIKQLPFLKGANNRTALGYNIPYIMGKMYDVPYKITNGCYRVSGARGIKQEWLCSFVAGYSPLTISDIKAGTQAISTLGGIVEVISTGDYQNSTLSPLNVKVTATSYGDEIPHKYGDDTEWRKGVVKQLEQNTYKADVCIQFNGLRVFGKKNWQSTNVKIAVEASTDGGRSWTSRALFDITENSNMTIRYCKTITFTAAECYAKELSMRLTRTTECAEKNGQETCYLSFINCYQYDAAKSSITNIVPCMPLEMPWRDRVVRIGICLESNGSTKDELDEINVMASAKARVWDKTAKAWTADRRETRNSAAWALEVLTSGCHSASAFLDSEIDLNAFGALYEMCEAAGFKCDGIITEDTKKEEVLSQILLECGATMFIGANGKWTVAFEGVQSTPIALLNEESIVSITASKDFSRRPFALKATYTNRDVWAQDTRYMAVGDNGQVIIGSAEVLAARGGDKSKVITEAAYKYVTEWGQLYVLMRRQLAKMRMQVREISVKVGKEGDFYPLYSTVMLQTHALKTGLSSGMIRNVKVWGGRVKTITTGGLCDFTDGRQCGMIIQHEGRHVYITVEPYTAGEERTRKVTVVGGARASDIAAGDIYSFGILDTDGGFSTVTSIMQITETKQAEDGWELSLRDYSDALYSGEGSVPFYHSNITMPRTKGTVIKPPTKEEIAGEVIDIASTVATATGKEAAEVVTHGVHFTSVHKIPDMETSLDDVIRMVDEARADTMDGISVTKDAIVLQITNDKKELLGALAVQAGAVTALVEGGGAAGQMQLSIELPVVIKASDYNRMAEAAGADAMANVYAPLVDSYEKRVVLGGEETYAIMGNAGTQDIKALWEALRQAGALASQIKLDAEQILLNGDTWLNGQTNAKKIKADVIDVQALTAMRLRLNTGGILQSTNWNGGIVQQNGIDVINIAQAPGTQGFAMDTVGNAAFMGKTVIGSGLTVQAGVTQLANAFVNGNSLDNSVMTICRDGCVKWASGFMIQWGDGSVSIGDSTNISTTFMRSYRSKPYVMATSNTLGRTLAVTNISTTGFYVVGCKLGVNRIGGQTPGVVESSTITDVYFSVANTSYSWLAIGF